jgi:cytidylate kinase
MKRTVIAIDGPSGSGKSTLGKAVARRLGFQYIDSGAVYRAIGCKALDSGVNLEDLDALAALAREADIRLEGKPDELRVYLDGKDVSDAIRRPDASHASSVVATVEGVRDAVVQKLRELAQTTSVVMDGRDIGTKVFPGADVKLFLDASVDVRARRRCDEEKQRGREVSFDQVKAEIEARDRRDRERTATPLVRAEDALLIDSSTLSVDRVVQRVLEIVNARG